ncbi:DUF3889 domain-containing protein [Paenisporosarcina sp. TG20]|uniref:DUF3889 domain-containing protein n=1 Tax=Paenisporosarcina sp. TG20 TaxID=1211706 RepID=UPI0002E5B2CA|nr:DUF3889 domain-containing protein [Paenisporosarcina sp. TG20]
MLKILIVLGTALILITFNPAPTHFSTVAHVIQKIPSYAKWGQIAMKETQSTYPNANIIDYKHVGSEIVGESTIETFKLWLKEANKEFGVFVRIEYITKTEKVVDIKYEETSR